MPKGRGKKIKVAAIVNDELVPEAKKYADRVIEKTELQLIETKLPNTICKIALYVRDSEKTHYPNCGVRKWQPLGEIFAICDAKISPRGCHFRTPTRLRILMGQCVFPECLREGDEIVSCCIRNIRFNVNIKL